MSKVVEWKPMKSKYAVSVASNIVMSGGGSCGGNARPNKICSTIIWIIMSGTDKRITVREIRIAVRDDIFSFASVERLIFINHEKQASNTVIHIVLATGTPYTLGMVLLSVSCHLNTQHVTVLPGHIYNIILI